MNRLLPRNAVVLVALATGLIPAMASDPAANPEVELRLNGYDLSAESLRKVFTTKDLLRVAPCVGYITKDEHRLEYAALVPDIREYMNGLENNLGAEAPRMWCIEALFALDEDMSKGEVQQHLQRVRDNFYVTTWNVDGAIHALVAAQKYKGVNIRDDLMFVIKNRVGEKTPKPFWSHLAARELFRLYRETLSESDVAAMVDAWDGQPEFQQYIRQEAGKPPDTDEVPPTAHDTKSPGEQYYFRMEPIGDREAGGRGYLYKVAEGDDELLYRTLGWFSDQVFVSPDGQYLARIGNPGRRNRPLREHVAIAFYEKGKVSRSYNVTELVPDGMKLQFTDTHYTFIRTARFLTDPLTAPEREQLGIRDDNGYWIVVETVDGQTVAFNMRTGMREGAGKITGRVIFDGTPAAGCHLSVSSAHFLLSTTTAEDGSFGIEGLAPWEYTVSAYLREPRECPYRTEWYLNSGVVAVSKNATTHVDLVYVTGASRLEGTIRVSGSPPASGEITVTLSEKQPISAARADTDSAGRFSLDYLPKGSWTVHVTARTADNIFYRKEMPIETADGKVSSLAIDFPETSVQVK